MNRLGEPLRLDSHPRFRQQLAPKATLGKAAPRDAWKSVKDDFATHLLTHGCSKDTVRTHMANVDLYARWCREHHVRR